MQHKNSKAHKWNHRKLDLVGEAELVKLNKIGFVEKKGRGRILRGKGNVEVFFPEKEDKKTKRYTRKVFLAEYARYLGQ